MKKSKVVMTMAIAIIAIVAVCSISFAAWSITTHTESGISVDIASPVQLTTTYVENSAAADQILVPDLQTIIDNNKTGVVELTTGTVTTTVANKKEGSTLKVYAYATATVGGNANTALVIKIADNQLTFAELGAIEIGEVTDANVTVSLPANADKDTYAGKAISITINFFVK